MKLNAKPYLVIALVLLALGLAACAPAEPQVIRETVEVVVEKEVTVVETVEVEKIVEVEREAEETPSRYNQAPELAGLVAAGERPPVDERLPTNPKVITPVEEVGRYGGTWRTALRGGGDNAWLVRTIAYEHLVSWTPDWTGIEPNVAESFEVNEDATEFTFKLREGLRWSDGEFFTADDILFWYEDIILNEEVTPSPPNWMVVNDKVGVVEKVDDYTVKFTFSAPNGLFLQRVATPSGWPITTLPKHYLSQFHINYNPDANSIAEELGYASWGEHMQFYTDFSGRFSDADLPVLWAWKLTSPYGENTTLVVAERNPYYWKVDTAGNQLPYIDRVIYDVGNDVEVLVLKALNGEIDMQDRHIATLTNKALFFDNQEQGNYHFFDTTPSSMNTFIVALNLTHQDPGLRETFQNKDFRIGLSHAINRQEIIDLMFVGQGEPYQLAPRPSSPFYNERLAKQYTEYDPELANQILDEAGFERGPDGIRLTPTGEPISFQLDVAAVQTDRIDISELISGYFAEVGVDMQVNTIDRTLLYERKEANAHDAVVWGGDGGLDVILEPRWYFPFSGESNFATPWALWYNNPESELAQEPPEAAKEQMDLYNQLKATPTLEGQQEIMQQILEIAADQFWAIGTSLPAPGYGIVSNDMRNVPQVIPGSWLYPNPGPTNPSQYFFVK